ncbi:unnamed protein product [Gordionus sp. m RMFG-2023]
MSMEFKYLTINAQVFSDKFNEKIGENDDSGIWDEISFSFSNFGFKSDSFNATGTIDDNRNLACIKDTTQFSIKPKKYRFLIYKVADKCLNTNSTVEMYLKLPMFKIPKQQQNFSKFTSLALFDIHLSYGTVDGKGKIKGIIFRMNMNYDLAFEELFAVKKLCHGICQKLWKVPSEHIGDRNLGVNVIEPKFTEKIEMKIDFNFIKLKNIFCNMYLPTLRNYIWSYFVLELVSFII